MGRQSMACGALAAIAGSALALLAAPSAGASRASCVEAGRMALRFSSVALATRVVRAVCPDLDRDGRRDVAVLLRRRGAPEWVALLRRRGGRWRVAGRGQAWGDRAARRGRLRLTANRHRLVLTLPVTARAPGGCTVPALRRRTLKLRGKRLRVAKSGLKRLRGCPAPATAADPPAGVSPAAPVLGPAPPAGGPEPGAPACRNAGTGAPDLGVAVRSDLPAGTPGKVLPANQLASQDPPHGEDYPENGPTEPHYPAGWTTGTEPAWLGIGGLAPERLVRAADGSVFNGDDAAYRVAHDTAYYGLSPISVGDLDGDGMEDLATTVHWATVDGRPKLGEVHVYFGRAALDPREFAPDLIFYGGEDHGRLGIEVAPAGDVNADGRDDMLMSAAFESARRADGTVQRDAGAAYVVYGGFLDRFACPVKVRTEDIGTKVPGLVLEGGHDGTRRLGWTNTLDSGDFDGDGDSDLLVGSYDPNRPFAYPAFRSRAYMVYGGTDLPRYGRFRLGVGDPGLDETVIEMPEPEATLGSTRFQTSFVGDLDADGDEEISIAGGSVSASRGRLFFFDGRPEGLDRRVVSVESADWGVAGDSSDDGRLEAAGVTGARPAGDVDGDGFPDVQISARSARFDGRVVGAVAVLPGGPQQDGVRGFSSLAGIVVGAGPDVTSIGMPGMNTGADFDADGYADLVVNDPYWYEEIAGDRQVRGRAWIVRGGADLPKRRTIQEAADLHVLADTRVPGLLGYQWNTGDFNGDGRPDLLIADHYLGDRDRHDRAGGAYLLYNGIDFHLR